MTGEFKVSLFRILARNGPGQKSIFFCDFNWWAHKDSNTIDTSITYVDDGTVFDPSGTAKTQKIVPSICRPSCRQPRRGTTVAILDATQ
jgi:hypothetical protein